MDYEGATRRDIKAEKKLMDIYRRQLEELPAGRLTSKRISGKTYYYKVRPGGKRQEYISVDNAQLVAALKDRRYAEEAMKYTGMPPSASWSSITTTGSCREPT